MCAVIYNSGWDNSLNWWANPVSAYCPEGNIGQSCDVHVNQPVTCTNSSMTWYQDAIDFAANRDDHGNVVQANRPSYPVVHFTRGTINLQKAIDADWPANQIGIHVPSGIILVGVPLSFGTTLIKPDDSWASNYLGTGQSGPLLSSVILLASARKGSALLNNPVYGNTIDSITVSGATGPTVSCQDLDITNSFSKDGIQVYSAATDSLGPLQIQNSTFRQIQGNAIEAGFYSQWVASSSPPTCANDPLCMLGLVLGANGTSSSSSHVQIRYNNICGAGYGGIAFIGSFAEIHDNWIEKISKTWTSLEQKAVGSTMGISAGFVGTHDVQIYNNTIQDGDYGIGADGSFPLYLSSSSFVQYWSNILSVYPSFASKYPQGPVLNDTIVLQGIDFIDANQVLLDLASKRAAGVDDETGFNSQLNIFNNTISNSVIGIDLFKGNWSNIYLNTISATSPFHLYGILFDSTSNSFVYSNTIQWWTTGVLIRGAMGDLSYWGSSYDGVGIQPPSSENASWSYPGNILNGNETSVLIQNAGIGNNSTQ